MAFNNFNKKYGKNYHTYPVFSQEASIEGAVKRFAPMPGPKEVFDYALLGLPKYLPLTQERITPDGFIDNAGNLTSGVAVADFLTSAMVEMEMEMDCNISEVTHIHSEDYIDGMFTNNFQGMRIQRWPATEITQVILKYPHTNTPDENLFQTYTIPPPWIYLRRNKVNIIAAIGALSIETSNPSAASAGGIFTYITGFNRGAWQPGTIEIVYKAGFDHDKLPAAVADLVKTWAAHRYLNDISAALFPNNSVSTSIDGISQSVGFDIQRLVEGRLEKLAEKKNDLKRAFKKQFGQQIGYSFIGS